MTTLFDKIWNAHVIDSKEGADLLYIDCHLIHEVTSPQAFQGLREKGRRLRRPDRTFATMDHNTPTLASERLQIEDEVSKKQLETLERNCREYGVELHGMEDSHNAIIHMLGPELGVSLPGKTIVCGDSHTATHGALGAIAFGIGTSEVEHVFATQCLWQKKPKTMGVCLKGTLPKGVYAKDVILYLIGRFGVDFGNGYALEFYGESVSSMEVEERLTLSNMAIEGGAKCGLIAPDEKTFAYVKNRPHSPKNKEWEEAVASWKKLRTDSKEDYDKVISMDLSSLSPQVTWGTNPGMVVGIEERFPPAKDANDQKAYDYMGLRPGMKPEEIPLSHVFIGSCTNGRYSDLKKAAQMIRGRKVKPGISAMVVPGSTPVKRQCEAEGIDRIFKEAGFEWREAGCSSCLGMNPDRVPAGKHCAATSNRNFEGRQGPGARTHLVSPVMAVLAALHGHFVDSRKEV